MGLWEEPQGLSDFPIILLTNKTPRKDCQLAKLNPIVFKEICKKICFDEIGAALNKFCRHQGFAYPTKNVNQDEVSRAIASAQNLPCLTKNLH